MIKNKYRISDAMKMNGGYDLSDLELARLQLQETQLKLSGRYIPPSERAGVISRQDAEDALQQTLANGIPEKEEPVDETAIELERIQMKLNSAPATSKAEARKRLRKTQALLTAQSRGPL
jgi:hypothetical protein